MFVDECFKTIYIDVYGRALGMSAVLQVSGADANL